MANIKGIDVSKHNGKIDWRKVANSGVRFAMIRASYGYGDPKQIDPRLADNVAGCEANGIPYGFYHYSYATSVEDAKQEALFFLQVIKGSNPSMPVVFDIEDPSQANLSRELLTDMCLAFCNTLEAWGYYAAIYTNLDWVRNRLDMSRLSKVDLWLAQWAAAPTYDGDFGMWQYSAKGKISGIAGDVDMNIAYKDYPAIIKKAGLNGWGVTQDAEIVKPDNYPAEEYNALRAEYDALKTKYDALVDSLLGLVAKYGG